MDNGIDLLTDIDSKNELISAVNCLKEFIKCKIENDPKRATDLTILLFYQLLSARIQDLYINEQEILYVPKLFGIIKNS